MSVADIVPVALGLPSGDFITLWAPAWREDGEDWIEKGAEKMKN